MFDGLAGDVHAEEGAVAVVRDLDVDGEALRVLSGGGKPDLKWWKINAKYSLIMVCALVTESGGRGSCENVCRLTFSYLSLRECAVAFQGQHYRIITMTDGCNC